MFPSNILGRRRLCPRAFCRLRSRHAEGREAPIGSGYKAVVRVPHGCDGAATTAIRIRIPGGIIGVKPMPKAGWTLETVNGKYDKPYGLRGALVNEGVTEVSWSGGKLPDAFYDEFVFTGTISDELKPGDTLYSRSCSNAKRASTAGLKCRRPTTLAATAAKVRAGARVEAAPEAVVSCARLAC